MASGVIEKTVTVDCPDCGDPIVIIATFMVDIEPRSSDMILRTHIKGSPIADHVVLRHPELID